MRNQVHPRVTTRNWTAVLFSVGPALLGFGCSCAPAPTQPSIDDTYSGVMEKISRELEVGHSLAIHPLLGEVGRGPTGATTRMDAFSLYDTHLVTAFVDGRREEYHLCTLTQLKTCDKDVDPVFVILSVAVELDEAKFGVLALIVDHRSPSEVQKYYQAYLQPRRGRWDVVAFRRVE